MHNPNIIPIFAHVFSKTLMIMKKKFLQRKESRYANNEFKNMPSIDYGTLISNGLSERNKSRVDMDKAREICAKYGFKCTYINSTFGGDDAEFVVYFKTDINVDEYNKITKFATDEDTKKFWEIKDSYKNMFLKLHDCMHELDEQTYLMFECDWHGNCGLFGSSDVYKQTYCGGDRVVSWNSIVDKWSPIIHDTTRQLSKGVYVLASTYYLKPLAEDSPKLKVMEDTLLDLTKELLSSEFVAKYEKGKRQCDNEPYKALVVRYKQNNEYCCMIRFFRDWLGRYKIYSARPLCGESSWVMDWKNPKDDLLSALGSCAKRVA